MCSPEGGLNCNGPLLTAIRKLVASAGTKKKTGSLRFHPGMIRLPHCLSPGPSAKPRGAKSTTRSELAHVTSHMNPCPPLSTK